MAQELHAIVQGRVQGVGFRARISQEAKLLGLTGTVRNLVDGSVEIIAQGQPQELESLINLIKKPGFAHITHVEINHRNSQYKYQDFNVTY